MRVLLTLAATTAAFILLTVQASLADEIDRYANCSMAAADRAIKSHDCSDWGKAVDCGDKAWMAISVKALHMPYGKGRTQMTKAMTEMKEGTDHFRKAAAPHGCKL